MIGIIATEKKIPIIEIEKWTLAQIKREFAVFVACKQMMREHLENDGGI